MTENTTSEATHERRTPPVLAVIMLLTAILTVMLIAFAWPSARTEPRDVPLGVAGPPPAAAQLSGTLEQNAPGAFEIHTYADRTAAVEAIRDREVYGAIVAGGTGAEVLTASARGPVVAQLLGQLATRMAAERGEQAAPKVTDVVPLPADDPRGAGLAAGALPLVLGGILAAVLLTRLLPAGAKRIRGAVGFAVTGGLALTAVLQFWLGSLEGNYWANSGVIAFSIAATSVAILGLEWVLGTAGLGLGAATMMLLGNPLSGLNSAPEMLPAGWGTLGQLLPPGAAGTMLRAVSFFDGADIVRPVLVLSAWLAGGLALCLIGAARDRARVPRMETTLSQPLTVSRG